MLISFSLSQDAPYWGGCYVNPAWFLLQSTSKSPMAQMDGDIIRTEAACNSHKVGNGNIAAFQTCNADTANHCTVSNINSNKPTSPPVWKCSTVREWAVSGLPIVPNPFLCPNSTYTAYYQCLFLSKDQCMASSKCSWIPELLQINMDVDVARDVGLSSGYAWKYGWCLTNLAPILPLNKTLAIIANASSTPGTNPWIATGFRDFYKHYIVPSSSPDILASYGSCPFGQKAAVYLSYKNRCYNTVNHDSNGLNVGLFNPIALFNDTAYSFQNTDSVNTTLLINCLKAGCALYSSSPNDRDSGLGSPAIYCDADAYELAKLKYGSSEEMLALVAGLCARNELLFNKTACLLAKL